MTREQIENKINRINQVIRARSERPTKGGSEKMHKRIRNLALKRETLRNQLNSLSHIE